MLLGGVTPQEIDPNGDPKNNIIKLNENLESLFSLVSNINDPQNSPVLRNANLLDLEKHRMLATNEQANLSSVKNLSDWIKGKRGEIVVKDDGDGGVQLSVGGDVGGEFTVGEPVVGGNANCVLYEDAANLIAQTVGFEFDGTDRLTIPAGGAYQLGGNDIVYAQATGSLQFGLGCDIGTGDYCTLLGTNVMGAGNNTGDYNNAFGYEALYNNTSGTYNLAVGYRALYNNTIGAYNFAMGWQALTACTIGAINLALGVRSMDSMLSGQRNVAIGYRAFGSATTASYSVVIGEGAVLNGNHSDLVAVGRAAATNGGGRYSVAIGEFALSGATAATNGVAVGYQAGSNETTGQGNTELGAFAGGQSQGGDYNVYIGLLAGYGLGGAFNADQNVIIGNYAGATMANNVSRCVILGSYAGYHNITADRLIVDNRLRANAATEQTHAIIFGNMAANPENQDLRLNVEVLYVGTDADADVIVTFLANSNNGIFTWMEDEDYFEYSDDILMASTERIYFNDTNTYIYDDGTDLNLITNGVLRFGTHNAIGAETVTGYITIKDAAGNTRKLAVVS